MINRARAQLHQHLADRKFLVYLAILIIAGFVVLTSASTPMGYDKYHDAYFFVRRQLINGFLPGIIMFLVAARLNGRIWSKYAGVFYGFSLLLLVAVFLPGIGAIINGSRGWIGIGNSTFQPSELAKLAVIIVTAKMLSEPDRNLSDWKNGLLPVLTVVAPALLLIMMQPDIGTLSILVVIIFVMLYLARLPKVYLIIIGLVGVLAFAALMLAAPYRVARLTTFLHPELDPQGVGYHINQSFLAIGSGGFWGLGIGHSRQKYQYLPEVNADSIFAVLAEETGFVFSSLFIILILLIGWRGLAIAKHASNDFDRLVVGGIMAWYLWQSFLNIGAMAGILPLTGVPLPLVSQGGSAMMTMLLAMGIVASISKESSL